MSQKMFRLLKLHLQARTIQSYHDKAFIDNQWVSAQSNKVFKVRNPATGQVLGTLPDMSSEDAEKAIDAAHSAYHNTWENTTGKERSFYLRKWFDLMVRNREELATLITQEAGKPEKESNRELGYGISYIEFFSEEAKRIHGHIIASPDLSKKLLVERQSIGVVGLITPWNFPHAMLARKAGAALAAGCTCVIKPAEDTPFTTLALMELAQEAGFPPGVLNVVTCNKKNAAEIGNLLCRSPKVAGISFTGSTRVGKLLYKECSSGIKRISLELGGDAPFIVYESANVDKAVKAAMSSKFRACGQACVASNRFFIHRKRYEEFVEKLLPQVESLRMEVDLGPLINQPQFDKVSGLVKDAVRKGAKVLTGARGCPLFYEPTVLAGITEDMQIYKEEVFGPVINLMKFECEDESIRMANHTRTGLAGYICSEDVAQIFRVSKRLHVGMCGVNEGIISMAQAPFGGVKESGMGREGSHYGIDDFTYIKYICIGSL